MVQIRYIYIFGRPEGKRHFGRHRRRWKDNVKEDLKETELEDVERVHVAYDRDSMADCRERGNETLGPVKG
jgi:hypothetical protein